MLRVDNLYEGQYFGDYPARNGYVVFSTDAPMWGERGRAEGVDRKKYDIIAGNMMMYGRKESGGFANCIPGPRQYLDYPHIAGIACPKPTLFISGTEDKLFKVSGVEKAFSIMHDVWDGQNASDNLVTELWPIPHSCGIKA